MSQTTEIQIINQAGLPFRTKMNSMLSALNTDFSGTVAPTTTEAGMVWLDTSTTPFTLRRRNNSNTAWDIYPVVEGNTVSATAKTTPVDADLMPLVDSAASNVLKKVTWANIKATLKTYFDTIYLSLSGGTLTGLLKFASGANIASASTVNLSTATGNTVKITGTTGISAWTMTSGQVMDVIFTGVLTLTHNATTNNLPSAANITTAANDRARYFYDGTTVYCLSYQRADGSPVFGGVASQSGNAGKYLTTNGSVTSWELPLVGVLEGGVGSTVMAARITATASTSIRVEFGGTVAGSDLRPVGLGSQATAIGSAAGSAITFGIPSATTTSLSGTWMCVGTEGYTTAGRITISLWRRIA